MALLLKSILEKLHTYEFQLHTSPLTLNQVLKWVNIVETEEIAEFLEPQELAFVTGVALGDSNNLSKLVHKLLERKACAIVLNLGPYIPKVPEELILLCNQQQVSLLSIPWHIRIANVTRSMTFEIISATRKNIEIEVLLKDALTVPLRTELYLDDLKNQKFHTHASYVVMTIDIFSNGSPIIEEDLEKYSAQLKSYMNHYDGLYFLSIGPQIVVVLQHMGDLQTEKMVDFLNQHCQKILRPKELAYFSVGNPVNSIVLAYKSYTNAKQTGKLFHKIYPQITIVYYANIGLYKLFISIQDKEVIQELYTDTVKTILDYDSYHQSSLFPILESYLAHNGSVQAVADEMFIHRNTVNYKLSKIAELLDLNLSSQEARTKLHIGIISHYYLESL